MKRSNQPGMTFALLGVLVALVGCAKQAGEGDGQPQPLSYAEALSIYNHELQILRQLKEERESLQRQLAPPASELVVEALEQVSQLKGELGSALEDLGYVNEVQPDGSSDEAPIDLLGDATQRLAEVQQRREEQQAAIEAEIARLDQEIAKQEERLARAKADKETAEAARK